MTGVLRMGGLLVVWVGILGAALCGLAGVSLADPLPVVGTDGQPVHGLYRRILTRPGANLESAAGSSGGAVAPSFSVFYVFAEQEAGGGSWLQVGPGRDQEPTAWVQADMTVPWNHMITLSFNLRPDRSKVLFFEDKSHLEPLLRSADRAEAARSLLAAQAAGQAPADSGLVAVEPETVSDFASEFYLLPVLEASAVRLRGARRGLTPTLVEVASLTDPGQEEEAAPTPSPGAAADTLRAGVVFVVDTTLSMQPYIDRTRQAVETLFKELERSVAGKQMSFGLVGYRDSLEGHPGVDYVARTFHPLEPAFDRAGFLNALKGMRASQVSTTGFAEDAIAGVTEALRQPGWSAFDARFVILVTDAPLRDGTDPLSSTGQDMADIAASASAEDKATAIFTIYLNTPAGRQEAGIATGQYQVLTQFGPDRQPLLFTVEDGSVEAFGRQVENLTGRIFEIVTALDKVRQVAAGATGGESAPASPSPPVVAEGRSEIDAAVDSVMEVMRLVWLRRTAGEAAPSFFRAWAMDFDPTDPLLRKSFDINVLLTRNQLNDLYQALDAMAQVATSQIDGDTDSFITQLRAVVARAQTDPTTLGSLDPSTTSGSEGGRDAESVDELGDLVDGYIRFLPYESPILTIPAADLRNREASFYSDLLLKIRSRMRFYEQFVADVDRWVKLNPDASDAEKVYPVPIDLLP